MASFVDLTGKRFGRFLVLNRCPITKSGSQYRTMFHCVCDCGNVRDVCASSLKGGLSMSCGCLHYETLAKTKRTHGKTKTRTYRIWSLMVDRCTNPNTPAFPRYGHLGICEEFKTFEGFYRFMGDAPDGLSIDRIDNLRGYFPDNVRWATRSEQQRNTSHNRLLTVGGITKPLIEWSESSGIRYHTLKRRIYQGWTHERAVNTPTNHAPRWHKLTTR